MTPQDKNNLLPCPFCGDAVKMTETNFSTAANGFWAIACDGCPAYMREGYVSPNYAPQEKPTAYRTLLAAWNTRALLPPGAGE